MKNKKLSCNDYLVLTANILSSVASFSFFPYISTDLATWLALTSAQGSSAAGIGVMGGSILAYFFSTLFPVHDLKRQITFSFLIGFSAVISLILINKLALAPLFFFAMSLMVFRFSISYVSNLIKTLQLTEIKDDTGRASMLGYIKVTTSVGGALGPIWGSFLINHYDVMMLLSSSAGLLIISSLLILLLASEPRGVTSARAKGVSLFLMPREIFLLCLIALIHFIFEAQIYAFMAISLKKNTQDAAFLPMMFSANAIFLVMLTLPVLNFIRRCNVNSEVVILIGSLLSLIAIIATPYCNSASSILLITLFFTLGEIITPQIILQKISHADNHHETLKFLSTYNLMTFGAGLTMGYFLSSLVVALERPLYPSLIFILVYFFLCLLMYIKRKTA